MATTAPRRFYILDERITARLGDSVIQTEEGTGHRFVMMSDVQAQYWVDQGAMGEKAPDAKRSARGQNLQDQMTGTSEGAAAPGTGAEETSGRRVKK